VIDYYKLLGIKSTASQAEIKSAYRKLARKSHPDLNPDSKAAREFALLSKAYHALSDPQERAYYDSSGTPKESSYSILDSNNPHAKRARIWRFRPSGIAWSMKCWSTIGVKIASDSEPYLQLFRCFCRLFPGDDSSAVVAGV
jgi:curved DNA-binding protein CbpA